MTVVTISTPKVVTANSTPAVTLALGDTLHVLATGGIISLGSGSPAISGAGANSVDINSGIAATAAGTLGVVFSAGNNDINIGADGTVFGQFGIVISGGHNSIGVAGAVTASLGNAINISGASN